MAESIVIVSAARTPIGGMLGDFSSLQAWELGAVAIKAAVERAGVPGDAIDEVLMGNCLMAGQGQAPARQAMRKAGLPDSAGAVTLSKMCGSGMRAMMFAHDMLVAGSANVRGGRRHGEHDQRAAPHVRAQGRALRPGGAVRPHGDRRPGRRLRARQGDGRVRRELRRQVRVHARGDGPVRDRLHHAQQDRPTKTAASRGRSRRSRWPARAATR